MFHCVVVVCLIGFILNTRGRSIIQDSGSNVTFDMRNKISPAPDPSIGTTTNHTTPVAPDTSPISGMTMVWIGLGILGFFILVMLQIICTMYYCIRREKRARQTIEDIIRLKDARNDNNQARYSKTPEKSKKVQDSVEPGYYESLPELDKLHKKPPPPPIDTLPKTLPHPQPKVPMYIQNSPILPPRTATAHYFQQIASMPRSRERIPTPKDNGNETRTHRNRSPMPLPHETPVKPSTLPIRSRKNSLNVRPKHNVMPVQMIPGDNHELLSKLKRRAAMNDSSTSLTDSISPPPVPKPFSHQAIKNARIPSPNLPRPRYENDSDEDWSIEKLKPLNLYNV